MPDLCHNTISLPEVENFKKTIQPYIHDRFEKVYKETDDDGQYIYAILPTGIPMMQREIDLDFEKIVPMPEPIKRTQDDSFDEESDDGRKLLQANFLNYGQAEWYAWVQENWGAKWSCYGTFHSQDKSGRSAASALRVLAALRERPVLTLTHLCRHTPMTFPTAGKAMQTLVAAGIARELTGQRRNRVFVYDSYLGILNEEGQPL